MLTQPSLKNTLIKNDQTLSRSERLKSRKIIEQVFKEGKAVSVFPIRISYKLLVSDRQGKTPIPDLPTERLESSLLSKSIGEQQTGEPILQAGFSVSSRTFKKAVDRNRIKRLLRESYRKQKAGLYDQLLVKNIPVAIFIIFTGKELPDYQLVDDKMKLALKKLSLQFS